MPKEIDEDSRIAAILGCAPEQVALARAAWQKNNIMGKVIRERLEKLIDERRTKLEKISTDDLKKTQGEIDGIRAALGSVLKTEK